MDLTPVLIIGTIFGGTSLLAWVFVDALRRKRQLQVLGEFHGKLLDRVGNGRELAEFMDSPGGSKFLDSITVERTHPAHRVLRAVQVGIVLTAAGIGCRVASWQTGILASEGAEGFSILGILLISLGLGYLVSAAAAFVLSRSLGLYDAQGATPLR